MSSSPTPLDPDKVTPETASFSMQQALGALRDVQAAARANAKRSASAISTMQKVSDSGVLRTQRFRGRP